MDTAVRSLRPQMRAGAVAGFLTCLAYPIVAFVPLPVPVGATIAAAFGPMLGLASWGLRSMLHSRRDGALADLAFASNALAGALVSAMFLVQLAVKARVSQPDHQITSVWLGLDVAWDTYIAIGTVLFAAAMARDSRFGKGFAVSGVLIGTSLGVTNLASFPTPPAAAGSIDLGPALDLWYFAAAVVMWRHARSAGA